MAKIEIAKNAGFCFGVKRATSLLETELNRKANSPGLRVVTLGKIIHNDRYIAEAEDKGAEVIETSDLDSLIKDIESGEDISLIIRAHGENQHIIEKLRNLSETHSNFRLLNGTCPYVEKVRNIARDNSGDNKIFILIGSNEHPEVTGIMSCSSGNGYVFKDNIELEKFISDKGNSFFEGKTVAIAAQTTQMMSVWKKCLINIEKVCTKVLIFDTICTVTGKRQTEAASLASKANISFVIGSKHSSNSQKLFEVCRENCPQVYFIGGADDLPDISADEKTKIMITAGASTPYKVIQEVYEKMSEQINENFAELLEDSIQTLNPGDVVEGTVSTVSANEIHVDLGTKTTGVIVHEKATTDPQAKLEDLFKVGDKIKAKVIKVSDIDGIATLDKTRVDSDSNWQSIVDAHESGEILEGTIVNAVNGGVIINLNSVRVFIPASLTGLPKDSDLNELVGTTQRVKIIEIKSDRKRALASIRAVLRAEKKAKEAEFWATVEEGMEFDGEVKNTTSFGAFVDLGGVDGMVHNTELSWLHIKSPTEVVSVGDVIHVYVKSIDRENKKISLGYKTEDNNPWTIFKGKYDVGDVVEVKIVNLLPFGAFAEIIPGVDGLIHVSQIADHMVQKPADELSIGQVVNAVITAIDDDKHKVSLSIRTLIERNKKEESDEIVEYSTDDADNSAADEIVEEVAEEAVEEVAEEAAETVEETVQNAAEEAAEAVEETVQNAAEETAEAVEETVQNAAEEAAEAVEETVQNTAEEAAEE